jgi:transcriptional regulator with XRE-family HTH domain
MAKSAGNRLKLILAARLKAGRDRQRLSQAALAERVGVSPGYIGDLEMGRKFPSAELLERLGAAFGVEPYRLLVPPDLPAAAAARELAYGIGDGLKRAIDQELADFLDRYLKDGDDEA